MYLDTAVEMAPMPEGRWALMVDCGCRALHEDLPLILAARYRFGAAVVGDKLYVFGGYSTIESTDYNLPPTPHAPYTMVYSFTTVSQRSDVYARLNLTATGHLTRSQRLPCDVTPSPFLQGLWDPLGPNSPQMNFPRSDLWGAAVAGKVGKGGREIVQEFPQAIKICSFSVSTPIQVYAIGGYNVSDNYNAVSTVEALDPATGKWTYVASMAHARWACGGAEENGVQTFLSRLGASQKSFRRRTRCALPSHPQGRSRSFRHQRQDLRHGRSHQCGSRRLPGLELLPSLDRSC